MECARHMYLYLRPTSNHQIKIKNLTIHIRFQSELQNQQQCQMSKNAQHTKWWFSSCVRPAQCMILTTFILTKLCSGVFFLFFKATLIWGFIFANGFFGWLLLKITLKSILLSKIRRVCSRIPFSYTTWGSIKEWGCIAYG